MANRYWLNDENHVDTYTEAERANFAEKDAPLVNGWTSAGRFTADSLEEAIQNARTNIAEANSRQSELGDISDYVAEMESRISLCRKVQDGEIEAESLRF